MIIELSNVINSLITKTDQMIEVCKKSDSYTQVELRAKKYADNVFPYFDQIRRYTDKLELLVDDEMWPMPKYREMLLTS
jgi:glutamine synthetase